MSKRPHDGQGGAPKRAALGSSSSTLSIATSHTHAANLLARVNEMRESHPEMLDIVLRAGGAELPAHALIMAAASKYIMTKLSDCWRDDQDGGSGGGSDTLASSSLSLSSSRTTAARTTDEAEDSSASSSSSSSSSASSSIVADDGSKKCITITIPDMEASVLGAAVEFAYTGSVTLDTERTEDALHLLAGLQILNMADAQILVEGWVGAHLDPASALRVRHMAQRHHMAGLKKLADEYVDRHFDVVTRQEEWRMLSADEVREVLTRDELRPGGEIHVFQALVRWVRGDDVGGETKCGEGAAGGGAAAGGDADSTEEDDDRKAQFPGLLGDCVRVDRLTSTDLSAVVLNEPLVRGSQDATLPMMSVLQQRMSPSSNLSDVIPMSRRRADVETKIFALGGYDQQRSKWLRSVECFSPWTGEWTPFAAMGSIRASHAAVVVDSKIYTMGGASGGSHPASPEFLDLATGLWTPIAAMSTIRMDSSVAAVDGKIYVMGGIDDEAGFHSSVECFDTLVGGAGKWRAVAAMTNVRAMGAAATVDGVIYVMGGKGGTAETRRLGSMECFDPSLGLWSPVAAMGTARYGHAAAVLDGKIYVAGGWGATEEAVRSVECYDPSSDEWNPVAPMGTARLYHGLATMDGKLYALGGQSSEPPSSEPSAAAVNSAECYDLSTEEWSPMTSMVTARTYIAVVAMEVQQPPSVVEKETQPMCQVCNHPHVGKCKVCGHILNTL